MRTLVGVSCALTLVTLAACGGSDETSSEGSSVTVWMYPVIADEAAEKEFWNGVESDFEAEHPDVDLDIELQPWEGRQEKITTALAAGSGPDIILLIPDQLPQYVDQGTLLPVNDVIEGSPVELLPNAVEALTVEGDIYGVPIYQTVLTTVYNAGLFEDAGISELPTTWDGLLEAAPKLAENGVATLEYAGAPEMTLNQTFYPLLWQAGGQVFTEDGDAVAFDGPEGVATLQFLLDLQDKGGLTEDVVTARNDFESRALATGKAVLSTKVNLTTTIRLAEALGEENVVVGTPLEGPGGPATFGIPGGLVLAEKAADNDGAREFLSFMLEPEVLSGLSGESGFFPPSEEVEMPDAPDHASTFREALPLANPGDVHPKARQVMSILSAQIQKALLGEVNAEEALAAAAEEANALLSNG